MNDSDRSVPRGRLREGDAKRDGRGRVRAAPAILHYGFRPFFLLGALYAAVAVPVWLGMLVHGHTPAGPFDPLAWHAHEMIFGYIAAIVAGFALTAVPNWTGRLPLSGAPLALLVVLWLAGRIATAAVAQPLAAALVDGAFLVVLAGSVWREIAVGRNWRNTPVAVMLSLLAAAGLLHHAEAAGLTAPGYAVRLALAAIVMLIALIGGRIVPSFTRNWLVRRGETRLPAAFGLFDKAALGVTAAAAIAWVAVPETVAGGALALAGGVLLALRMMRWRGGATLGEPIVAILHIGYAWLAVSLALIGLTALRPDLVYPGTALHALSAGAVGTMTLAVMTRATLGHTGRAIVADGWTVAIYLAVTAGAALRVAADYSGALYQPVLAAGGLVWSLAFALFVLRYGPMLTRKGS